MSYIFDDDIERKGSGCYNAILNEDIVRQARIEFKEGQDQIKAIRAKYSLAALSKKYGVKKSCMGNAISGVSWRHV